MNDKSKKQGFLAYINTPMSRESIIILYGAHNIKFEKCELYGDFVQSLLQLAFSTYMGDDYTSVEQQAQHFNWCWNKNNQNFLSEGILFNNDKLYDYFLEFMFEVYYTSLDKIDHQKIDKDILNIWCNIFDYNKIKTNSDMDTLIEIYQLMDNSLKTT